MKLYFKQMTYRYEKAQKHTGHPVGEAPSETDRQIHNVINSYLKRGNMAKRRNVIGSVASSDLIKIGLISDTHIPDVTRELPAQIFEIFKEVDLILHSGDVYWLQVLDWLEKLAPVLCATGDDDYLTLDSKSRMKEKHVLTVGGLRIGICHKGFNHYLDMTAEQEKERRDEYFGGTLDIMIYGHSHRVEVSEHEGVLYINPGSATFPSISGPPQIGKQKFYRAMPGTVGILEIKNGKADVEIIQLSGDLAPALPYDYPSNWVNPGGAKTLSSRGQDNQENGAFIDSGE